MKALIVGLGSIGARHANNLHALGVHDLSVYRTSDRPPPRSIPDEVRTFHDYNEALNEKPDIVIIANPTSLHLDFALEAARRGCHLYLEKPVSHTMKGVAELTEAVRANGCTAIVGCQLRYHPGLRKVKDWIDEGLAGRIMTAQVDLGEYLPGWHPWEDYRTSYAAKSGMGGGVILTLIHELDYCHWLFGRARRIFAMGGHRTLLEVGEDLDDTAMISLETESGVLVQLRMDYWRRPPVRRFAAAGDRGCIHWDYTHGTAVLVRHPAADAPGAIPAADWQDDIVQEAFALPDDFDRNELFLDAMNDFLESIRTGKEPAVPLSEGVAVLETALAAKASIQDGQVHGGAGEHSSAR